MNKVDARKLIKERLNLMSDAEREWASGAIIDYISQTDEFKMSHSIFCFLNDGREPETEGLIGLALGMEKTVAVPKVHEDYMDAITITPFTNFYKNKWGILEPEKGQKLDEFDLIICPMVGFNGLDRLGHGKGYYDKFLSNTKAKKLGICFDIQEIEGLETEKHDIKLDMVVTEKRVITKKKTIKNNFFGE